MYAIPSCTLSEHGAKDGFTELEGWAVVWGFEAISLDIRAS